MKIAKLGLVCLALSIPALAACSGNDASTIDDDTSDVSKSSCTPTAKRTHPIELSVLPEAGESPFVDNMKRAGKSIYVMVYMMGQDGIYNTLIDESKAGIDVRVIMDGGNERTFNTPAFNGFKAAGVQVEWSQPKFSFMHAKTFVVDNKFAVISTGNYPLKLIQTERNYVALDNDLNDAKTVQKIFLADWDNTDPDISCTRLVVSPVNSEDRINAEIKSAKKSLHIESLELADTGLIADIVAQKQAGRDVEVLLADPTWSKGSKNAETAVTLQKAGIEVKWIPKSTMLVHVKSILVDGETAYMGSENLTSTSMEQNREIGLIVTDPDPLATMEATFEKDFASAIDFGSTAKAAAATDSTGDDGDDDDGTN
jgi:cardiolipin synthase A/B